MGGVFVMTDIVGIVIIIAVAYYIIKNAVKNGVIEADKYIKEQNKNKQDLN